MRKISVILLVFLALSVRLMAGYRTQVLYPDQIKTLRARYADRLETANNRIAPERPFLVLQNGIVDHSDPHNQLEISFDEMSHNVHQYTYTILHLNSDRTESSLNSSEYVRGFTTADITYYEQSVNTSLDYTHYSFLFPNEEMTLTASGNYAIQIYEDGDKNKTIAWVCFSVVEPQVKVAAHVVSQTDIEYNGRYQQLEADIVLPKTRTGNANPGDEYWICVQQNGRTDNEVVRPKMSYIEPQRIRYTHCQDLIFEGGNEYRRFDAFSTYMAGENIYRIARDGTDYHAMLEPDALRNKQIYIHEPDADGQYIVNAERTLTDVETEAEYMYVHWLLRAEKPIFEGNIYVAGDLFYNRYSSDNRMLYDAEEKCYYLTALIKQGGYDYQYQLVEKGTQKATLLKTEGSHWETENEYTVYVYRRPFGSRYDQLVGLQVIHSAH